MAGILITASPAPMITFTTTYKVISIRLAKLLLACGAAIGVLHLIFANDNLVLLQQHLQLQSVSNCRSNTTEPADDNWPPHFEPLTAHVPYNRPLHYDKRYQCQSYGSYIFSRGPVYYDLRLSPPVIKIFFIGPKNDRLTAKLSVFTLNGSKPHLVLPCSHNLPFWEKDVAQFKPKYPEMPGWQRYLECRPSGEQLTAILNDVAHVELKFDYFLQSRTIISSNKRATSSCVLPLASVAAKKPPREIGDGKIRIDVCAKAMYVYDDWIQFMQFVEWWLYAGVTQVWVKRESVSPSVDKVLWHYQNTRQGLTVLPSSWDDLRINPGNEAIQTLQMSDYILRLANHVDLLAHSDLDEFMLYRDPKLNVPGYLEQMMREELKTADAGKISGWEIQRLTSVDYPTLPSYLNKIQAKQGKPDFGIAESSLADIEHYMTSINEGHDQLKSYSGYWPKLIVRPENVVHNHVHFVLHYLNGQKTKKFGFDKFIGLHLRRVLDAGRVGQTPKAIENPLQMKRLNELVMKTLKEIRHKD